MQGLLRNHPRIWIGAALGVGVFFSLPTGWLLVTRVLVAWDCGVTSFLVLLWVWMSRLTAQQICSRYIEEDASGPVILVVVVIGALLSLVAIVQPLATLRHVEGSERMWHFVLAAVTLAAPQPARRPTFSPGAAAFAGWCSCTRSSPFCSMPRYSASQLT
jgi:uncharacterized membrane protein